ncbi:hypothetical protein SAMN06309944_1146 [Micrococcales bacterium KH10]|nr:hypothetical protein SAMN06309944_1146 [Micrococcales bacterium KH10]
MTAKQVGAAAEADAQKAKASASITMLATSLWVVVGALLSYGVIQTVLKAAQLFNG